MNELTIFSIGVASGSLGTTFVSYLIVKFKLLESGRNERLER